jgi:hypothetical protein
LPVRYGDRLLLRRAADDMQRQIVIRLHLLRVLKVME